MNCLNEIWSKRMNENIRKTKGGLRKIADEIKPCFHLEYNPPSHICLQPGTYEYVCPSCGKVTIFNVSGVWL
jgi:hypothetical protein